MSGFRAAPVEQGASGQAGTILALLYVGYLLSFADRVIFGLALKPIKQTLALSDSQLGLLAGVAFAASYALFSPLGGFIVDRARRTVILASSVAFWSAATFATALMTTFTGMGLARTGVGAGEALLHPLAVSLLGDTVPAERRPRAFSLYMSAGAVGAIAAQVLGGLLVLYLAKHDVLRLPLIGEFEPWQGLFMAAAIPGLLLAAAVLTLMREPQRTAAPPAQKREAHSGVLFLRRYPYLALAIFAGIATIQMGAYTFTTWVILFFERVHDLDAGRAALWIAGTGGISALVGCLLAGNMIIALKARGYRDAPLLLAIAAAIGFAGFGSAALAMPNVWLALLLLPLATFWSYIPSVAAFSAMGEVLPPPIRARLAGIHTLANGIIANSLGPYLAGAFSDHFFPGNDGIRWALVTTMAIAAAVGIVLVSIGRADYRALISADNTKKVLA